MPRAARFKSSDSIFHIMCRGNNSGALFKGDQDRDMYLSFIKRYQKKFLFKVYGYCLMTTHVHIIIDVNGADISKIMQGINQCYAQYYHKRNGAHGHVFQDRFKSRIVNDDSYLVTLSAYIHNNPTDIRRYRERVEEYKYSSLGIYLGLRKDDWGIVDQDFVMSLFSEDRVNARKAYLNKVYISNDIQIKNEIEFKSEKSRYVSGRTILRRDASVQDISEFVSEITKTNKDIIYLKRRKRATESKALCAFLMRCLCDFSYGDICGSLGGISISRAAALCDIGLKLMESREEYSDIVSRFLKYEKTAGA